MLTRSVVEEEAVNVESRFSSKGDDLVLIGREDLVEARPDFGPVSSEGSWPRVLVEGDVRGVDSVPRSTPFRPSELCWSDATETLSRELK